MTQVKVREQRRRFAVGYVALAIALLVTACAPSYEKVPFAPGTWTDDAAEISVTLNADGSGSVVNVPYLLRVGSGYCLPDETFSYFTGEVRWRWDRDSSYLYLDMPDAGRSGFASVGAWRADDWSKLEYWACGPRDLPGNLVMMRSPEQSSAE